MNSSNRMIRKEERVLPVFLLVDTSGSMLGEKIGSVNVATKEMIRNFMGIENPRGVIHLEIITFGDDEVKIVKELGALSSSDVFEFVASGKTPMGRAFTTAVERIENDAIVSKRDYHPTIILISDGFPTDFDGYSEETTDEEIALWEPLQKLHASPRCSKAVKLAMGIGNDAATDVLQSFIKNKDIPVITAKSNRTIENFFEWTTMMTSVRSLSANPNNPFVPDTDIFDDGELFFPYNHS